MECLGYQIEITDGARVEINSLITSGNVFLVTDSNIARLYRHFLQIYHSPERTHIIKAGEGSKTLKSAELILKKMFHSGCDRKTVVLALGGGVVGDLAGFVSAVYMRGVPFIQLPTSLLAMVDSSVGGKTGVDLDAYKNIVGSFKQPERVLIDLSFLKTLPFSHVTSGLGEIVKTALLDESLFDYVNANIIPLTTLKPAAVKSAVEACIKIKAGIVASDEKEAGPRRVLNAGHTVGHAIETYYNCALSHGEYVLSGLYYELMLGLNLGVTDSRYAKSLEKLLDMVQPSKLRVPPGKLGRLSEIMLRDKKNTVVSTLFVLPEAKGKVTEHSVPNELLLSKLKELFN